MLLKKFENLAEKAKFQKLNGLDALFLFLKYDH